MVRVGGARALAPSPAALCASCGILVVVLCRPPLFPFLDLVARPCDGRRVARPLRLPRRVLWSVWLARESFLPPASPARESD